MKPKIAIVAGVVGAASFGFALLSTAASPETPMCDGEVANVVAQRGDSVTYGTFGDDRVILGENVLYVGNGGTDTICNQAGDVEAVVSHDGDAVEPPANAYTVPDLTTLEEQDAGAWNGG